MNKVDLNTEKIINDYLSGKSTLEIAKELNVSIITIQRRLKGKVVFRTNTDRSKYNYNRQYFKQINTPDKAYWLGVLMADGCISSNLKYVILGVKYSDKEWVEQFVKYLKGNMKVNKVKTNTVSKEGNLLYSARLNISCKEMAIDLSQYGVIPRKSCKEIIPDIEEKYIRDFIRGYFDGDGSISFQSYKDKKYPLFSFMGSFEVVSFVKRLFTSLFNLKDIKIHKHHKDRNKSPYTWAKTGKEVQQIYDYLYYKDNIPCLQRKKNKFEELLKIYEGY